MLYKQHAIYNYFQSWVKIDKVKALSIFFIYTKLTVLSINSFL